MSANEEELELQMVIKVIGIGEKGAKAVGKMIHCVPNAEHFVVTEELDAIHYLSSSGEMRPLGFVAGERVVGTDSPYEIMVEDSFVEVVRDTDLVFVVTGMEDSTVADMSVDCVRTARDADAFTIAVTADMWNREREVSRLHYEVDSFLCISLNSLMPLDDNTPQILSEPALADHLVRHAVGRIVQCVTERSFICLDFADIKVVLGDGDNTYLGIGIADGPEKGKDAASRAVQGISRQGMDMRLSDGILAIVEGSTNMTMDDFEAAARVFNDMLPEETNVVFGCYFDDVFGGNMKVTVFSSYSSGKMQ